MKKVSKTLVYVVLKKTHDELAEKFPNKQQHSVIKTKLNLAAWNSK